LTGSKPIAGTEVCMTPGDIDASEESAEDRIIARYFKPLARDPGAFGLSDDAAILTPPAGYDLVLKTDPIICGVHFFAEDPPDAIARKALRVNLSDLAAKGASPAGFLLALAIPAGIGGDWLQAFAKGLGEDAEHYGCPLLGGDTDRTPGPITVSIAAIGTLPHGKIVRRSGAKVGDYVLVSGTIGDAALGLTLRRETAAEGRWKLSGDLKEHLTTRYLLPQPRNALAEAVRLYASAAMDISDGLAGDLAKLCRASGVSAEVEAGQVPLSAAAAAALAAEPALTESILTGGDDYEILCTVGPDALEPFRRAAEASSVAVTAIGRMTAVGKTARFLDASGRLLAFKRPSYSHF
jgi:thiamine-monophosphate kinase